MAENILELGILVNLINSPEFFVRSFRFYKPSYFITYTEEFEQLIEFVTEFEKAPNPVDCQLIFDPESIVLATLDSAPFDLDVLLSKAEQFCKDAALFEALGSAVEIVQDGAASDLEKNGIPEILAEALKINFSPLQLHSYVSNADERWEFYNSAAEKIRFSSSTFNRITNGGVERGTLNVFMAATGVGKTMIKTSLASDYLKMGKLKILYVTLEMSAEKIANRIDANLLDVAINDVANLKKDDFVTKVNQFSDNLKIIQFPPTEISAMDLHNLLDNLEIDHNFAPDILFIDYLNLMSSTRVSLKDGSYTFVKSIAEEVRALAIKRNLVVFSSTQVNRGGTVKSKSGNALGEEDTSESSGLPATTDMFIGVGRTQELDQEKKLFFSNIKNRYVEKSDMPTFLTGVAFDRAKIIDLDESDYMVPDEKFQIPDFSNGVPPQKIDKNVLW